MGVSALFSISSTKLGQGPPLSSLIIGRERLLVTMMFSGTRAGRRSARRQQLSRVARFVLSPWLALQRCCNEQNPCQGCKPQNRAYFSAFIAFQLVGAESPAPDTGRRRLI